jgi:RNA polymerase sigma factor (sigma-70 family)
VADAPADPSEPLLRRWQDQGDPEALDQLLEIEVRLLKHMIRGRRPGPMAGSGSTSDIAQEAVLGLLKTRQAPAFENPGSLRGYLWRSAWHLLAKRYERRSRQPMRVDLDPDGAGPFLSDATSFDQLDREERAIAIGVVLNLLSEEDRELLRLVYFEGQEVATAGAALGLSRSAANSRLVRARRVLATRLAKWSSLIG